MKLIHADIVIYDIFTMISDGDHAGTDSADAITLSEPDMLIKTQLIKDQFSMFERSASLIQKQTKKHHTLFADFLEDKFIHIKFDHPEGSESVYLLPFDIKEPRNQNMPYNIFCIGIYILEGHISEFIREHENQVVSVVFDAMTASVFFSGDAPVILSEIGNFN